MPYLCRPIVAGLSGGRDSVALLLLLKRWGCRVFACHVHHGIRGEEADADAKFSQELCERLEVPFECRHANVPALAKARGESLETAARHARRAILAEAARRVGGNAVALAHHANDQAETALFRLARGSAGLRGMKPAYETEGIAWLRPLLGFTREQITEWLRQEGQCWQEDSTNAVADVARNRIRLKVLPALGEALGRDIVPIINRSVRLGEESREALGAALGLLEPSYLDPQGRLYLPFVMQQPPALRKAILHRYLVARLVPGLSESLIDALDALIARKEPPSRLSLPGGKLAIRQHKRLVIGDGR